MSFMESWGRPCLRRAGLLVFVVLVNFITSVQSHAGMSSIVVEAGSGRVLQETSADERHYPASLTKMMTLYLTFKALDAGKVSLQQQLPVSRHAAAQAPTKLGLRAGQRVPLQQLILGLVTQSANDAAVTLAEGLLGTEAAFARQMTLEAQRLGMASTVFRNASGLPDRNQYTTAHDMARLAQALLRDFPGHYSYFSTRSFSFAGRTYLNHNRLLGSYPGVDGIKTGFIRAAGFNLAASARRQDRRVVAVVLGGRTSVERDRHMMALLDSAFDTVLSAAAEPVPPPLQAEASPAAAAAAALSATGVAALPAAAADAAALGTAATSIPARWSIQVGAFSRREAAEQWAGQLLQLDSRMTMENQHIVEVPHAKDGTIFAVRFANLSAADATDMCRSLADAHRDCFVVSPVR